MAPFEALRAVERLLESMHWVRAQDMAMQIDAEHRGILPSSVFANVWQQSKRYGCLQTSFRLYCFDIYGADFCEGLDTGQPVIDPRQMSLLG